MEDANLLGGIDRYADPNHPGVEVFTDFGVDFRPAVERRPNFEDDFWRHRHVLSARERPLGDAGVAVVRHVGTANRVWPSLRHHTGIVRHDASERVILEI